MFTKSPTTSYVMAMLCGLTVASPSLSQAKDFHCAAGDTPCLVASIHKANTNGQKNTIRLQAGTYALTAVVDNTDGPSGLPSVTGKLTIEGFGADRTEIVGGVDSGIELRLLHVAPTGDLVVKGLTLRGGLIDGFVPGHFHGGGGVYNLGTLTLRNVAVTENLSLYAPGGGVRSLGPLNVVDSTFSGNIALPDGAGAIHSDGPLQVTRSTIVRNDGDWAGGVASAGAAVIAQTTIAHNGGHGVGGVVNVGSMVITDSALYANTGTWTGGVVNGDVGSTLDIRNSTVAANLAFVHVSGGINNEGGEIHILNSTIVGNQHLGDPFWEGTSPGIGNLRSFGTSAFGTVSVVNTIVAQNSFGAPPSTVVGGPDCGGPIASFGTNLIGDPTDCGIALQVGDRTGDPGLGDFVDNGTPGYGHIPLLSTSQAIDTGNDAVCPKHDQLGQRRVNIPRVGTSRCDVGAVEFPPP